MAAAAGEIVGQQVGVVGAADGWIVREEAGCGALGWIGEAGLRVAAGVDAGRVEGGVDDGEGVVLAKEGLRVVGADFEVVDALYVGEVGVGAGVGERAVLPDGLGLDGAEVGERIGAGVVVVRIAADVATEVEDGVIADGAGVGWGDVEGADFGALVGVADVAEDGVRRRCRR